MMNDMKAKIAALTARYAAALKTHLNPAGPGKARPAGDLGTDAMANGLDTLDLARIHDQALPSVMPLDGISVVVHKEMIKRAGGFFADAITRIEETHRAAVETNKQLSGLNQKLNQHARELAAMNLRLQREIDRRKKVEISLKASKLNTARLLAQSHRMQEQLRRLSHEMILSHEAERKQISRELHDQVSQTLAGINVHLAALKVEALSNNKGLAKKIAKAQRLVVKSVRIVHRFALELRPTILDDLGLVAALNRYLQDFAKRTRVRVRLVVSDGIESLSPDERIVLFRVAQAALTNVGKHAKATSVLLTLRRNQTETRMEIQDDGKSFQVEKVLFAKRHKRLGVLGMRERVDMIGGAFNISSAAGKGTTVQVRIPNRKMPIQAIKKKIAAGGSAKKV